MYNLVLIIHVLIVAGLLGTILIQRGRSGGLIESLGGVESIFGTKTSSFFVKLTVVLAILFFITSISLAYLSKEKGKSLMDKYKDAPVEETQTKKSQSTALPPLQPQQTAEVEAQATKTPQTQSQPSSTDGK